MPTAETARSNPAAPAPKQPPRNGRRSRAKSEANLERLLGVAAALMARQGYEQTTIRDVARETGFSLAGMYYYFAGKEELLYKIQERTFGSLLEEQERLVGQGGRPDERLRRLVRLHLSYMADHASELKVCTYELESLQGDYYAKIERLRKRYFKLVAGVIADLMGDVEAGGNDALQVRHTSLFVFGILNWSLMWYDRRRDGSTEKLAERVADFVLRGLPQRPRESA